MHKSFIAIPLTNEFNKGNAQLTSLLDLIGLSNRIYSPKTNIRSLLHTEICWEQVDCKMDELRQKGVKFLNQVLE